MTEIATVCDSCRSPIRYGDPAWTVPTGRTKDCGDRIPGGLPVVQIICCDCHANQRQEATP